MEKDWTIIEHFHLTIMFQALYHLSLAAFKKSQENVFFTNLRKLSLIGFLVNIL